MRTHPLIGLFLAWLLATGVATAQSAPVQLAQNTAAPDRGAAGSGSMGIGQGIEYLDDDVPVRRTDQDERRLDSSSKERSNAEPGHGGNETNMEHRRRSTLGDRPKD